MAEFREMADMQEALRTYFGFEGLRPGQNEVVQAVLEGRDAMGIMPTGGGKSLCYQLPALCRPGLTVVVSPLIALMKDQVDALQARGIPAAAVNSSLGAEEYRQVMQALRSGELRILYVAPERFAGESKYTMKSLVRIAMNTLNCFSVTPMRVGAVAAGISLVMTVFSFAYYIGFYVKYGYGSGTALLCSMITFLFSLLFLLLGTIGEYLGMLMLELKGRPIYIVEDMRNM